MKAVRELEALHGAQLADLAALASEPSNDAPDTQEQFDAATIDAIMRDCIPEQSWPKPVRAAFARESAARLENENQFLLILGFLVAMSSILLDMLVVPELAWQGAILRLMLIVPLTILGLVAGAKGWKQVMTVCVGAAPIAFVGVIAHLAAQMSPEDTTRYLTTTALVVGIGNLVLPYSLRQLVIFDVGFIAVAFGTLAFSTPYTVGIYLDYLLLLVVVAGATLPLALRIERLRRHNFLLALRAQAVSRELTQANRTLRELSERDPLTGMANRRYFERAFAKRIAQIGSAGDAEKVLSRGRVAVMMIDLDHFKSFNDTNGHQAGDQCLIQVGRALQRIFATVDGVVARYGGEEFIAAIREREDGEAARLAEDVRLAVTKLGGANAITTSVGVALSSSTVSLPREELIEMADAALYNAKRNGRNRVEVVEVSKPVRLTG